MSRPIAAACLIVCIGLSLSGCTALNVASAAVSVASTAVGVAVKTVGVAADVTAAGVRAATSDDDSEEAPQP